MKEWIHSVASDQIAILSSDLNTAFRKKAAVGLRVYQQFLRISKRLHPASRTEDIILIYINGFKCLQVIGFEKELYAEYMTKFKTYLKTRSDLTRSIIEAVYCQDNSDQDIELVLGLFPTHSQFPKEYQKVLSRKLLQEDDNIEFERSVFNKVASSTTDVNLNCCDVMLHDIELSRSEPPIPHNLDNNEVIVTVKQLSGNYWPDMAQLD
ncbi:hypothetical protein HDU67_004306, partial [Dinochytrium kinnereticum]